MTNKKLETNTPPHSKPCVAQIAPIASNVTVKPMGNCCENIIQEVNPISISMRKIKTSILKGKVNCENSQTGVEGVIVIATGPNNQHYVGITNRNGKYSICVPAVDKNTTYSIEAYCCGTCTGDICEPAPCDCGCKDARPS